MNKVTTPRRLSLFFANDAPIGIVLKRGPSDWVQLIKWDVTLDHFDPGQWLMAKIDPQWVDVSPDGQLIVYFAANYKARALADPTVGSTWTAVSKPPYFTALALWPTIGKYFGGGFFESSTHLRLNNAHAQLHAAFDPCPLTVSTGWPGQAPEMTVIRLRRMLRRGWHCLQESIYQTTWYNNPKQSAKEPITEAIWAWDTPRGEKIRALAMGLPHLGAKNTLLYRILPNGEEHLIDYPVLDWDQQGRMVRVDQGKIFAAEWHQNRLVEKELIDLNSYEPEPCETPLWARVW